ncbi:ROK family protein [Candidatus Uhrbacteria bacterium]|nr:ROK family protein [Candidatus Uhrbacteria bacterium]
MKPTEYILGLDVGASKIKAVLWHKNRTIKQKQSTDISAKGIKNIIDYFQVPKVGIGIPGIIDRGKNIVIYCPSAPQLNGLDLNKLTSGKIRTDNDGNCLLRAESELGFARGLKNVLGLAFGTGIGGSVMIAGKIYIGQNGSSAEFGHMILSNGKSWEALYQKHKNDPKKQELINTQGIANLINIFDPELIIIGGGAKIKPPKQKQMAIYINSPLSKQTKIIRAKLGTKAQAIGAALLY